MLAPPAFLDPLVILFTSNFHALYSSILSLSLHSVVKNLFLPMDPLQSSDPDSPPKKTRRKTQGAYRGVRMRAWGKWVSEIRIPKTGQRIWLGSFDSPEKAARAYDAARFCIHGEHGQFNFPFERRPELKRGRIFSLSKSEIKAIAQKFASSVVTAPSPVSSSPISSSDATPVTMEAPSPDLPAASISSVTAEAPSPDLPASISSVTAEAPSPDLPASISSVTVEAPSSPLLQASSSSENAGNKVANHPSIAAESASVPGKPQPSMTGEALDSLENLQLDDFLMLDIGWIESL